MEEALRRRLAGIVGSADVVLFMKGNRQSPRCGFSARVVEILDQLVPEYATVDVLSDPGVREGMKELSRWPTFPQLYVRGKFVGGCDIVTELHESGELETTLGVEAGPAPQPALTIREPAAHALREALRAPDDWIHLSVSSRFEHDLSIGPRRASDIAVEASGVTVLLDRASAARADGIVIDFVDAPEGRAFKIDNPNAPPRVRRIDAPELKRRLDAGPLELYDVRSTAEREKARIEGARLLDEEAQRHILSLPRSTPLYFHCHRGSRSQAAAEHFVAQGFTEVYNLAGGIDAWSREVDPSVGRY
jgi:monothiol glutaredoxin